MSEPGKAVFLSYASQDAEAARRICEALRAAGVEVWFDQNELVGGDAWDAKIRRQIAECALFVPIVSANTQARREGYFRLEWKLAAQRTHMISDDTPFLLPVVIDDTRDGDARVPAEFKTVQWTRLAPGADEALSRFCARVTALLGGEYDTAGTARSEPPTTPAARRARTKRNVWRWATAAGACVGLGALGWWFAAGPGIEAKAPKASAEAVISEASRLVAKAWEQMDKTEMARNELMLAESYCRQAAALEETNPAVWAAWSAMKTWHWFHHEFLPVHKEAAREYAQKALALDPNSYDARYAWAHFTVRTAEEAGEGRLGVPVLRELLRERPDEPRALFALGYGLVHDPATADEGFAVLERLAEKHPWFAGRALDEVGWMALFLGRFALAESAAERAVQAQPYWNNLGLKATLALRLHGDLELAQVMVDRLPPTALQENWGISLAVMVAEWRGDYARAIAILQSVPRDWLENFFFNGPTSLLSGWMRVKAGQKTAAEKDLRRALELIAGRLEKAPNDRIQLWLKAEALRLLGDRGEADKTYRQLCEVWPNTPSRATFEAPEQALEYVRQMARRDYTLTEFPVGWWFTAASLRLDPMLENVRRAPGFQSLLEEVTQREKARWAKTSATPVPAGLEASPAAPEKSVAVLAFENRSGERTDENLAVGIADDLIMVLGRVPGLRVAARTSSFHFQGKPVPVREIARELGVAYVVEGSVQKDGARVKVNVSLIKADDGFQVWREQLVHELRDVLALQERIAGVIAQNLSLQLGGAGQSRTRVDPRAFERYAEARVAWGTRTPEGFARAERALREALEIEPRYVPAMAALIDVESMARHWSDQLSMWCMRNKPEVAALIARCEQALALDPRSAEALVSRGGLEKLAWRFAASERSLRDAVRLNPNNATAHQWLGRTLLAMGRMDEALASLAAATRLDPLAPRILDNHAWGLILAARPREALVVLDRALVIQPDAEQALGLKAVALARLGDRETAIGLARRVSKETSHTAWLRALVMGQAGETLEVEALLGAYREENLMARLCGLAALGRHEAALQAIDPEWLTSSRTEWLFYDPVFDPMRSDPRFHAALRTVGLEDAHARAQAWRAAKAR